MRRNVVLIGASGMAREAINVVRARDAVAGARTRVVILDDDPATWGRSMGCFRVSGGLDLLGAHPDHDVVVCVGKGTSRRWIVERLRRAGVGSDRFATLVHPSVVAPQDCLIGAGTILMAGVVLTADVVVGDHVVVMPNVTLTHGDEVGSFATLCAGVALGGDVHIASGAYLGMNASVRERVQVGRDAVLGMGSVLLRDLPAGEAWAGSPAHPIERRTEVPR